MTRTDNDTWDLASSVGVTATMVAAARAVATNADEPLIDDPYAEPLVRAVGVDFFTRWVTGEIDAGQIDDDSASWGLKHMPYAMAARTQFFDGFFAAAAEAGIRQAVILAAGLDCRAYRLSWPDGATVFEIDQPQVIAFKRTTLTELGATPTARLKSLAIDLREDWASTLEGAGFDSTEPSAWIAEGLFAYLPPQAQDSLLDKVTELSAPGSMLGVESVPFDLADYDDAQATMRETTDKWRDSGLDLDISELVFDGERNDVVEYVNARGWSSEVTTMRKLLDEKQYPAIPKVDGLPSMADILYSTSHKRA